MTVQSENWFIRVCFSGTEDEDEYEYYYEDEEEDGARWSRKWKEEMIFCFWIYKKKKIPKFVLKKKSSTSRVWRPEENWEVS